jgi:hypothetical protein
VHLTDSAERLNNNNNDDDDDDDKDTAASLKEFIHEKLK